MGWFTSPPATSDSSGASRATCFMPSGRRINKRELRTVRSNMKSRALGIAAAAAATTVLMAAMAGAMAGAMMAAEVSSPTKMTVEINRGPAWGRLRTAAPALFAGTVPGRGGAMRAAPPTSWFVTTPLDSLGAATFFDAMDKQDPLYSLSVEASSSEKVSAGIPGLLDYRLAPKDI